MTRSLTTNPDSTSRLILDIASSSPLAWGGPLGPEQLNLANHHGLIGLAATRPENNLREPLLGPYARLAGRQELMRSNLARFLEKLNAAGIPAAVVKGPDLASRVYGDPRHRTFTDIDILVPEASLASALDIFASDDGVATVPKKRPKADKRDIPVEDSSGRHFMVDLHWDLFSYSQLRGVAAGATAWGWDNAVPDLDSRLGPSYILPEEAYLAFLCTHALLDHRFRLILFRDLAEVAARGVDWESVARFASNWNLRVFTYLALSMANDLVGAGVPSAFLDDLRPSSLPLTATEVLMSRTDIVRFDGHRPHPLNLAMVLLHDQRAQRLQLLAHAPPAVPTWMKRFGRPRRRTLPMARKRGDGARVMILVSSDQRRGAEVFGENLASGLRRSGWDADLVALEGSGSDSRIAADRVLRPLTDQGLGRLNFGVVADLRKHIRTSRPHIVLANGGSTLRYASAALFGMRDGPRFVYSSIGEPEYWIRGPLHRFVQKSLHESTDLIVAVSNATRRQLVEYVGIPEDRVRVAHTGVAEDLAQIGPSDRNGSRNLLFLGNLSKEKSPKLAIDLMDRIRGGGMELRFVGTGPLEDELRLVAERRVEEGSVEFSGSVDDVGPYLEWADILVLPSITEGLPGAVLEAGAAGVPAVAFDVGGVSEAIADGKTGILVPAGDLEMFASEVESLLNDPERRGRLGSAARDFVADRFLLSHTVERYIDCFDSVLLPADG